MKVEHYREVEPLPVEGIEEATAGLTIRRLISEVDGATEFTMDVFEIEPDGHSAFHDHPWEHQIFVLSGEGTLVGSEGPIPFKQGDVIFIAPDEPHQFVNDGEVLVEFVCLIPKAALTAYYIGRAAERSARDEQ
ncbi:MAG: cupin domain-containing protein [Gaiellaceae bacterium]